MQGRFAALSALVLVVGLSGGILIEKFVFSPDAGGGDGPKILYWVAPMDPNFRKDGPGKSPMGMDLIPVYEGQEATGDPEDLKLEAREINAIGVRTATARLEQIANTLETVGFVNFNDYTTSHIHTRVEGWIEQLKVRAVGDQVKRGDLLFVLYAPEISIASSELRRGYQRNDQREIMTSKRKLKNFGVTDRQIEEIARSKQMVQHIKVYAPQDGVVIDMAAADGMYLKPDTRAVSLSDLSSVWLVVDVFERDLARLTRTMKAYAKFDHLPGQIFEGEIDYIYPELDAKTRTLPVRLKFDNTKGLLRPNMFGAVSLVPNATREAVTVPSEAVIRTGRAERVILKTAEGTFRPRLVTTGLRDSFGNKGRTEIVQGLQPGEEVVASAHFLIDSESALNAGLLRMAPTAHDPVHGVGQIVAVEPEANRVVVAHDAIPALDWPALETVFVYAKTLAPDRFVVGEKVRFALVRGADGLLSITDIKRDDGVAATANGIIHGVTADGKLSLTHDPIKALGWPSMTMDMDVVGFDPNTVPVNQPIQFDLMKDDQGLYAVSKVVLMGKEGSDATSSTPEHDHGAMAQKPAADILRAQGRVNAINLDAATANITHGPLKAIGMPGMTMDFAISPNLKAAEVPLDQDVTLLLEKGADFSLTLVGVEDKP